MFTHFSITPVVKKLLWINITIYIICHWLNFSFIDFFGLRSFYSEHFLPYQLISHLFLHADFFHLLSNMLALYMLGPLLEKTLGSRQFLMFFFFTGIGASFMYLGINFLELKNLYKNFQYYMLHSTPENFCVSINQYTEEVYNIYYNFMKNFFDNPHDEQLIIKSQSIIEDLFTHKANRPIVGASGAIFGILMAFAMLFPNVSLFMLFIPIPIKAKYFVALYGIYELYAGVQGNLMDNVAHFAHLGGIIFAYIFIKWIRK